MEECEDNDCMGCEWCDLHHAPNVAALFVDPFGAYLECAGVDMWDESRDAMLYNGPHPVVAHPPCARWCKMAKMIAKRFPGRAEKQVGADGGVFASALASVRRWGGVLEHPAWSLAWPAFGLAQPDKAGGWSRSGEGWVCWVAQSAYGHAAQKNTWLYMCGAEPPIDTIFDKPKGSKKLTHFAQRHTGDFNDTSRGHESRMSGKETHLTPPAFAAHLVTIARSCRQGL